MLKRILAGVLFVFVAAQFVRPKPNVSSEPPPAEDFIVRFNPPAPLRQILLASCYDCHSNHTHYPWYSQIQPVGWWLANHVADGKRGLNFSEFGKYSAKRQNRKLDQISDEVTNHTMPLRSYTWTHPEARLKEDQILALSEWCDGLHDRVGPEQ